MHFDNENRPQVLARYMIENKSTVRSTASAFKISKSTVHKDISGRLKRIDPALYYEARKIIECNKSERHIRGGDATRRKYESAKQTKNT